MASQVIKLCKPELSFSYLKRRKLAWRLNCRLLCIKSDSDSCSKEKSGSTDSKSSDDHKHVKRVEIPGVPDKKTDKKARANENLVSLLSKLKVENGLSEKRENGSLNLAKPLQRMNKKKVMDETKKIATDLNIEEKLVVAVKDIVSNAGNDSEEIKTELINGIISVQKTTEDDTYKITNERENSDIKDEVSRNMMYAVEAIASTVVEDTSQVQEVKSDLTKKLLALAFEKEASSKSSGRENMNTLFEGLKIEKEDPAHTQKQVPYGDQQKQERDDSHFRRQRLTKPQSELQKEKIDLFASPPLGVFNTTEVLKDQSHINQMDLILWSKLANKELKSLIQFAPNNAFEEMIQLTEQGKHWTFPIDNEFDMGEEENVGFHEHVFLDYLLEGFPKKGPIRHFMELVVTALSKNPYITVERKKENVEWFRQYFNEKKDILQHYES